jgi:hypothetical protein
MRFANGRVPFDGHRLKYSAILEGSVNQAHIRLEGQGQIDERLGLTSGTYRLQAMPKDMNPILLTAVLITGYPNASAETNGVSNPFKGRSYSYDRQIEFSGGEILRLRTVCELDGVRLSSHFYLEGCTPGITVRSAEPLVESWTASGTGITGSFTIFWKTSSGAFATGQALSRYEVDPIYALPPMMYRRIEITARAERERLWLRQKSRIFRPSNASNEAPLD